MIKEIWYNVYGVGGEADMIWIKLLCSGASLFDAPTDSALTLQQSIDSIPVLGAFIWGIIILVIICKNENYKKTTYFLITKNPYLKIWFDKGLLGEYAIYKKLKHLEKEGTKFLFNVYLPKENEETTEIDVLMISQNGIYVFESKNYSGWIFGNEKQKYWTQTLPRGRGSSLKTKFLNPIIQNKGHIKYLKDVVGEDINVRSIVVFSERCTFKDLTLKSEDIKVINRYDLAYTIENLLKYIPEVKLEQKMMDEIYEKLYPYTQVSEEIKEQHIKNIRKSLNDVKKETFNTVENHQSIKGNSDTMSKLEKNKNKNDSSETSEEICPRCGGKLVKRMAKTGKYAGNHFMGCTNYPKCRYIKNE